MNFDSTYYIGNDLLLALTIYKIASLL